MAHTFAELLRLFTAPFRAFLEMSRRRAAERQRQVQEAAAALGLSFHSFRKISGEVEGLPTELTWHPDSSGPDDTNAVITFPWQIEPTFMSRSTFGGLWASLTGQHGERTGDPVLDKVFRFHGDEDEIQSIFLAPDVRRALLAIAEEEHMSARSDGNRLRIRKTRCTNFLAEIPQVGPPAIALALALKHALMDPWDAVQREHGLSPLGRDHLRGQVDGLDLEVDVRRNGGAYATHIVIRAPNALPAQTRIGHAKRHPKWQKIGDMVLDVGVRAQGDVPTLKQILGRDPLRGLVMGVVHAHPRSEIRDEGVALIARGRLAAKLPEAVATALELAQELRTAPHP